MNKRVIVYVLGAVLLIEAALMLLPLLVAVIYREKNGWYFLWVLLGAAVLGALALGLGGRKRSAMYAKEGLIAVALSWIVLSLVGALPFTLSGQIPFYLDAVFEMISGFTTTGSSILPAVEPLDRCMLFWRSLSHWIGGQGILVFMLAIVCGTRDRPSICCVPRALDRQFPRWSRAWSIRPKFFTAFISV